MQAQVWVQGVVSQGLCAELQLYIQIQIQMQKQIHTKIQGTTLVTSWASQANPRVHNCPRPLRHAELQSSR